MRNSTQQFLKTKSNMLTEITPKAGFRTSRLEGQNYINHDHDNLYRTSYNDMTTKVIISEI